MNKVKVTTLLAACLALVGCDPATSGSAADSRHQQIAALQAENARLKEQVQKLQTERELLARKLDNIIKNPPPMPQPKPYLPTNQVLEVARRVDARIRWEAYLVETQLEASFRGVRISAPVWIVEGTDADGRTAVLYLDAITGREVTRLQLEARGQMPEAASPRAVVERFYALIAAGHYEAAWPLLHPVSQKPNPPSSLGAVLARFYAREGSPGPRLDRVLEVKLLPEGWKWWMCACRLQPAAQVMVQLADGKQFPVYVAQDEIGNWGLIMELGAGAGAGAPPGT